MYKTLSAEWGKAHLRHGAVYFADAIGDDVQPDQSPLGRDLPWRERCRASGVRVAQDPTEVKRGV
jgi:hypothetical protein